ncbi:MAG TPA: PIN domain-containing protein [Methanotrichaceae archaeon]|nr:PIN domain-containing protein [Methanotrichaceae archaeon]
MIFIDTNVLYSVLVETEFSEVAKSIILSPSELATSTTVLNELIFTSTRKLCKERYGARSYSQFRKIIASKGYEPFKKEIDLIFQLIEDRGILVLSVNECIDDWKEIMARYNLLPTDALIASTCIFHEIKEIATFDNDFKRVNVLKVIGRDI